MKTAYLKPGESEAVYVAADAKYRQIKDGLLSAQLLSGSHADAERWLDAQGKDLLRKLFQSHITVRGQAEPVGPVVGSFTAQENQTTPANEFQASPLRASEMIASSSPISVSNTPPLASKHDE